MIYVRKFAEGFGIVTIECSSMADAMRAVADLMGPHGPPGDKIELASSVVLVEWHWELDEAVDAYDWLIDVPGFEESS